MIAHAGSVALQLVADRTGLTSALSTAVHRHAFLPVHDRGRVLADVAVILADDGEAIPDVDVLRHQASVLMVPQVELGTSPRRSLLTC